MTAEDVYRAPSADLAGRSLSGGAGEVTAAMFESLRKTKPWVLLIGILLLIVAAFSLIGAVFMIIGGLGQGVPAGVGIGVAAIYVISAVIYLFLGLYLFKYSRAIGRAMQSRANSDVEAALAAQASFWKLGGILALISLIFVILGIVLGGAGMIMGLAQMGG